MFTVWLSNHLFSVELNWLMVDENQASSTTIVNHQQQKRKNLFSSEVPETENLKCSIAVVVA